MKKSIKKKITPENEKYWEHVKRVAEEVGNWPIEKTMGVLNNPHRREERGERGGAKNSKNFSQNFKNLGNIARFWFAFRFQTSAPFQEPSV